jgi:hypothetical protein
MRAVMKQPAIASTNAATQSVCIEYEGAAARTAASPRHERGAEVRAIPTDLGIGRLK